MKNFLICLFLFIVGLIIFVSGIRFNSWLFETTGGINITGLAIIIIGGGICRMAYKMFFDK
jgi:hypothetical protein